MYGKKQCVDTTPWIVKDNVGAVVVDGLKSFAEARDAIRVLRSSLYGKVDVLPILHAVRS